MEFGDVIVDLAATRVTVRGEEVRLTPTEWRLLEVLVRHPGKLLSQRQLLDEVWGPGYETAQGNLRLYMAQLRRKLEPEPSRPRYFLTETGHGLPLRALTSRPGGNSANAAGHHGWPSRQRPPPRPRSRHSISPRGRKSLRLPPNFEKKSFVMPNAHQTRRKDPAGTSKTVDSRQVDRPVRIHRPPPDR